MLNILGFYTDGEWRNALSFPAPNIAPPSTSRKATRSSCSAQPPSSWGASARRHASRTLKRSPASTSWRCSEKSPSRRSVSPRSRHAWRPGLRRSRPRPALEPHLVRTRSTASLPTQDCCWTRPPIGLSVTSSLEEYSSGNSLHPVLASSTEQGARKKSSGVSIRSSCSDFRLRHGQSKTTSTMKRLSPCTHAINPGTQVCSAPKSLAQPSIPRHARGNKLARIAALTILGAAISGCRPPHDHSQGVELVTSTDSPTPAMTFELRFEPAMVRDGQVGPATTNSPMVITPPVTGTFTWLSTHSGVFVPTEPLALDRHYELTLRPGLQRADGQRPVSTAPDGDHSLLRRDRHLAALCQPQRLLGAGDQAPVQCGCPRRGCAALPAFP